MTAAEITAAEQIYRQALAALSEGIVVQDKDGAITSWNPAAERILGLSARRDDGRPIRPTRAGGLVRRGTASSVSGPGASGDGHADWLPLEGVIMGVQQPDGS